MDTRETTRRGGETRSQRGSILPKNCQEGITYGNLMDNFTEYQTGIVELVSNNINSHVVETPLNTN